MINLSKRAYGLRGGLNRHPMPPEPPSPLAKPAQMAALQAMAGHPINIHPAAFAPQNMAAAAPEVPHLQSLNKLNSLMNNKIRFGNKKIENV